MLNNPLFTRFADPIASPKGSLKCGIFQTNIGMPVSNALIQIRDTFTGNLIEELTSDSSGQSPSINLSAPPVEYSLDENSTNKPYAEYNVTVIADGFNTVEIEGIQLLSNVEAIQNVELTPKINMARQEQIIVIKPHTLWGEYPPKIPETEEKPMPEGTGFVVLDKPVIPEYIVVHDGSPNSTTAKNYWILYKDYIKNVASSEIYATWPYETIAANVHAIISFTLNRVFTEWYRAKGKNFTITSSTAYDHAFFYGRNIYKEISTVVDNIFNTYITRPGLVQPLFTQYCDGKQVKCPNWMTQWGSKALGDQGYSAINILKHYYGQNVYLTTASKVVGVPSSYPGTPLKVGSRGENVRTIQRQLNAISKNYPAIGKLAVDGVFGNATKKSVQTFQTVFNLPSTGIVDSPTWYKISDVYVAVTKMAELV